MNADVERAMNWLKGMADDRGYTEHLAHGGKGDPIEEQEIECASTALKYIESLQAQLAKEKRRADKAVEDMRSYIERNINKTCGVYACDLCAHGRKEVCKMKCDGIDKWKWRGDAEEGDAE
jgi:hypothetical protein